MRSQVNLAPICNKSMLLDPDTVLENTAVQACGGQSHLDKRGLHLVRCGILDHLFLD